MWNPLVSAIHSQVSMTASTIGGALHFKQMVATINKQAPIIIPIDDKYLVSPDKSSFSSAWASQFELGKHVTYESVTKRRLKKLCIQIRR